MTVRSKIAMLVAEFLGAGVLAAAAINVSRSQIGIGYFVAFGVGITFAVLTLIFNATSGAHFNPAVTIGMWTLRKIKTIQALAFIAAQMLGGFAAWRLVEYLTSQPVTSIAAKTFDWKVLVAEVLGTFVLTFGIAAAIYQRYEGGKLAATVGMSLFAGVLVASFASNAALNPAVALANQTWDRAYIFGPIIGSILGMNLYALLFAPNSSLIATAPETMAPETPTRVTAKRVTTRKVTPAATKKKTSRR